jgi:hypothetical protein
MTSIASSLRTQPWRARVFSHERGGFSDVRDGNVLIYWPHGFGDWVQLSYILPFLERSNRYWITRYGDDNVSVLEGHASVTPVYLGINSTHCGDGKLFGNRHFGISYGDVDGTERELRVPAALHRLCRDNAIDTVLWSSFPETAGHVPYPFHTKARNVLRYLIGDPAARRQLNGSPLESTISFQTTAWLARWVEARLRNFADFDGKRLCILGRNGYTSVGKNWGHLWREDLPRERSREGEECRDFMRLMLKSDPRWLFLVIEDRLFDGDDTVRSRELCAVSYAELFGTPDTAPLPFGLVMKALIDIADLCVGVPAAPYHLAMTKSELPVVGIWTEHLPSWFDEPKADSVHVVSRNLRDRALDRRPGSFARQEELAFRLVEVDSRVITGEQVMSAVEALL